MVGSASLASETEAVDVSGPVAFGPIVATILNAALPPAGTVIVALVALRLPAPTAGPEAPPKYAAVHVCCVIPLASDVATVAAVAVRSPILLTTTLYVICVAGE